LPGSGHPQADGQGGKLWKKGAGWLIGLLVYKLQAASCKLQEKGSAVLGLLFSCGLKLMA
jgi:uncharacterized membrane protein YqjE